MITVVSGLSRSGTSLMMRMLKIGGLELVTNGGDENADACNPDGYFESDALWNRIYWNVKNEQQEALNQCEGKCVKIQARLATKLNSDLTNEFRVVWMTRSISDVKVSRDRMLATVGTRPALVGSMGVVPVIELYRIFKTGFAAWAVLRSRILVVRYEDLIADPYKQVMRLWSFINDLNNFNAMAAIVRRKEPSE